MTQKPARFTLAPAEGAAWGGFIRAHALITRQLDADLQAAVGLALSEFEILLHLAWAGGERRMAQIAHDVVLTGGGVTRIVARLEKLGLIERRTCPQDRRGVFAALTEKGRSKQLAAQEVHLSGVRRLFLKETSEEELKMLGDFFGRMAEKGHPKATAGGAACDLAGSRTRGRKPRSRA